MEGRTSFVIAQRIATVLNADQILVLDGGRIVDQGVHEELMERSEIYTEIYTSQLLQDTDLVEEVVEDAEPAEQAVRDAVPATTSTQSGMLQPAAGVWRGMVFSRDKPPDGPPQGGPPGKGTARGTPPGPGMRRRKEGE
jgi:ATP-binding cassette subfamily B protein